MHYILDEDLITGHPEIDAQHQVFLSAFQEFQDAIKNHEGRSKAHQTLSFLRGHLASHFLSEETLMVASAFPGTEAHRREHAQFLRRHDALVETFRAEDSSVGFLMGLSRFCIDLTFSHIQTFDKEMARHLAVSRTRAVHPPPSPPATARISKVLIVEDSDLIRRMYDMVFRPYRREGTVTLMARDAEEGLALLRGNPDVSLIITDRNLPGMDGLAFIRTCKENRAHAAIPILVVSTLDAEDDIREALRAGARGYITKPFTPEDLNRLLERLFPSAA